jgi:NMD protein affecting ribosome stability and mRNA decay
MTPSDTPKRSGRLYEGTSPHKHKAVTTHTLRQHAGIPYEVEQRVCTDCHRVLDERTVRRAAA